MNANDLYMAVCLLLLSTCCVFFVFLLSFFCFARVVI